MNKIRLVLEKQGGEMEAKAVALDPDFVKEDYVAANGGILEFTWEKPEPEPVRMSEPEPESEPVRMPEPEPEPQVEEVSEVTEAPQVEAIAEAPQKQAAKATLEVAEVPEEAPGAEQVDQPVEAEVAEVPEEAEVEPAEPISEITEAPEENPLPAAVVSPSRYPKSTDEKYKPKTSIGRYFLKDCHGLAAAAMLALFFVSVTWLGLDYYIPETVNITYKTLEKTRTFATETRAGDVGALIDELKEDGIKISGNDFVSLAEDYPIEDKLDLTILISEKSEARIAGEKTSINMIPGTVEENLTFNGVAYDTDDEIEPALAEEVTGGTRIIVDEVHYTTEEKTEKVKAEDTVILDPEMESGVQETTEGNDGEGIFEYRTRFVNGRKGKTTRKVKKWITEPHDNTLHLGTGRTGHEGTYSITGTFTANCSAYWMGNNCYGAGGGRCVYGTVAVDTGVYPYGTLFWIEGYGFAVANDCGTSIKGNKLDLWMDSYDESCRWGRRHMTTYILEEKE